MSVKLSKKKYNKAKTKNATVAITITKKERHTKQTKRNRVKSWEIWSFVQEFKFCRLACRYAMEWCHLHLTPTLNCFLVLLAI